MRELTVVVGGQYGSEGKGAVVGHIAHRPGHTDSTGPLDSRDLVIRVGGPNAGHTVVDPDGQVYRLRRQTISYELRTLADTVEGWYTA